MKQKESEQQKKERMIKYAASLGVTLTVSDKLSEKIYFPEKVEEAKRILANTKPDKK
ncbi:hypothetical protein [Niastella caeni]|uniref:hypothetical protein n=1 Tax=Niastella caeni TaxID=2569763 RepID=UPI00129BCF4E|nr:hypothetical protein [Niastella caeni]